MTRSTEHRESAALEVQGIRFVYPGSRRVPARRALGGIDLRIDSAAKIGLLGPNGSGKSTLMKIASGLLRPGAGSVRIFGRPLAEARSTLGVVFQNPALDKHLTVYENLRDQAQLFGLSRSEGDARIAEELNAAGVDDRRDARVKSLSGGLARRVDLCRALLHRPRLLLLDEPTAGLDPLARERFLAHLTDRQERDGMTILLSTHLVDEADACDRVVLMHEGVIVANEAPGALRNRLCGRQVVVSDRAWSPSDPTRWLREAAGWVHRLEDDAGPDVAMLQELVDADVPFAVAPPTLADVFEQLTGAPLVPPVADPGTEATH